MREAVNRLRAGLWLVHRTSAMLTYLGLCLLVGVWGSTDVALDRGGAWDAGLDDSRYLSALALPICLAQTWGVLTRARAEDGQASLGADPVRLRRSLVLASFVLAFEGVALAVVPAGLLTDVVANPTPLPPVDVTASAAYAVLTVVSASGLTFVLTVGQEPVAALVRGLTVSGVYLVVTFGDFPGRIGALAAWPTSAPGFVARGTEQHGTTLVLVAVASVVLTLAGVAIRTGTRRAPQGRRSERRWYATPRAGAVPRIPVMTAMLVVVITVASLVPRAWQLGSPPGLRPSLLLQRLDGEAPEQVAGDFYQFYRQGSTERASTLATGGDAAAAMQAVPAAVLAEPFSRAALSLVASPDLTHAEVGGQVGALTVCFGLTFAREWTVDRVSSRAC